MVQLHGVVHLRMGSVTIEGLMSFRKIVVLRKTGESEKVIPATNKSMQNIMRYGVKVWLGTIKAVSAAATGYLSSVIGGIYRGSKQPTRRHEYEQSYPIMYGC